MRPQDWTRYGAVIVLIALSASACDEGTSPADEFDAQETAQTLESMMSAVEAEELDDAYGSLEAAGQLFAGPTPLLLSDHPIALDVAAIAPTDGAAEVIPQDYWGSTLVWDDAQGSYVLSDRTGAPSNGVRVVYYAIDPTTDRPASPLNELGYVDLTDQSTADSDRLGVQVVRGSDDATLADYYFDLAFMLTQSAFNLDVSSVGFLSNGADQLNFDVSQSVSATATEVAITQDFSMDLEGTDNAMSFSATVTADPETESEDPETMDATASISNGAATVRLEITWMNDALEGTIFHNDQEVVLIGGTLENPEFTDLDGNPLTSQQLNALQNLWDDLGDMFDFVEELFGFATE